MQPVGPEHSGLGVGREPDEDQQRQGDPEDLRFVAGSGEVESELVRQPVADDDEQQVEGRVAPVGGSRVRGHSSGSSRAVRRSAAAAISARPRAHRRESPDHVQHGADHVTHVLSAEHGMERQAQHPLVVAVGDRELRRDGSRTSAGSTGAGGSG